MNTPSASHQKAAPIRLEANAAKIVAAICYVIAEAQARGQSVTQYDIVKTLFLADKKHLNDFGRPVTFDNYCAMNHGPVPSLAYDLLKENAKAIQKTNMKKLPWTRKKGDGSRYFYSLSTRAVALEEILSPSDKESLSGALTTIKSLTFPQIRQLTHNDQAYIQAWSDEGGRHSYPMDWGLFYETPNPEAAKELSFLSKHQ